MDEQHPEQGDSSLRTGQGNTRIDEKVVSKIARMTAGEVEGVLMGGNVVRTAGGLFQSVTGSRGQTQGASAEIGETETAVDLTMEIEYGKNIPSTVERVRDEVGARAAGLLGVQVETGKYRPTADAITVDLLTIVGDHQSMKPYSEDLRRRIVKALQEGGMSKSAAARLFDVSLSSVKRYARIASRGASLEPRRGGGRPPKVDQTTQKLLEEDVQKRPAATVSERCQFLEQLTAKSLSDSTIRRVLKRLLGFSQKNGLWVRQNRTSG